MARWALALALLLMAPSAAVAREPIISYKDAAGTFRLWDEELNAEVTPLVPVPANFIGFRSAVSMNGRYIVFNDDPQPRKLHLLDRATNTQLPLPGIDVYNNPDGLTVSDTGLIGFDDNGNGPALVYSSATQTFVDTGLPASNGHRQTRLSGNGGFLATTCLTNCVVDLGSDSNPYVQNLGTRLDTAFPDDDNRGEKHPCINGDGSRFGFDKQHPLGTDQPDIFLFDRSISPPQAIPLPGLNDAGEPEVNCVLDAAGEYLGVYDNNAAFRVYNVTTQSFLTLPAGNEFTARSTFSAPYPPPPPPPGGGTTNPPPPNDVTDPAVRRFRMTPRRFRPGRRAAAFRFVLSEPADVRIVVRRRRGKRAGAISRADLPAGANTISFSGRFRGRALRAGRYVALLTATDAAGNASALRTVRFRVLR